MRIIDKYYGHADVPNSSKRILLSSPMQRLKGIYQSGINYNWTQDYTRWEHSLGCYILAKKLHFSEYEAVMALIHDVYHTNFSHNVDYINHKRCIITSYHEANKMRFLSQAYGIDDFLKACSRFNSSIFNLVHDRYRPHVKDNGIDMIDYTIRDFPYCWELITVDSSGTVSIRGYDSITEDVQKLVHELKPLMDNYAGKVEYVVRELQAVNSRVVASPSAAHILYCMSILNNIVLYLNPFSVAQNLAFADILKESIGSGLITMDLLTIDSHTDKQVLSILNKEHSDQLDDLNKVVPVYGEPYTVRFRVLTVLQTDGGRPKVHAGTVLDYSTSRVVGYKVENRD